ncbi:MAG: type II toxin-antitoxin system VapC family toxin [Armatimonadetes bacterium]|nr:type II toxin-antitoxin system VapC family toxin [Armatimonadota bacterium]
MIRYLLDTDTFSLWRRGDEVLATRLRAALAHQSVGISVVTVEEQLGGWFALLRRTKTPEQEARIYTEISRSMQLFALIPVLPLSEASLQRFATLKSQKLNVGSMDLRIASLTLELGAVVVTRNRRDYERIPGVVQEDWTIPE